MTETYEKQIMSLKLSKNHLLESLFIPSNLKDLEKFTTFIYIIIIFTGVRFVCFMLYKK